LALVIDLKIRIPRFKFRNGSQRNLFSRRGFDVNLLQSRRLKQKTRLGFEDNMVLIVALIKSRNLALAESIVKRVVNGRRRDAETRSGVTIDDEFIERAPDTEVHAVRMRVLRPEDVLVTKLLAMREHEVDYESVLEIARAVREQIDWDEVRRRTEGSPYAKAFLTLVEELEVSS